MIDTSGANDGKNEKVNGPKPTPSLAPEGAGAVTVLKTQDVAAQGATAPASQGTEDSPSATFSCSTPSSQSRLSSVPAFLDKSKPEKTIVL